MLLLLGCAQPWYKWIQHSMPPGSPVCVLLGTPAHMPVPMVTSLSLAISKEVFSHVSQFTNQCGIHSWSITPSYCLFEES